jgi:catechol 2,3-dioxygenase-like lactoylglutathione lyase family enzyme
MTSRMDNVAIIVEDLDDTLARLRTHGAELVAGVARYEDSHRLCYVRGPAGVVLGLAEELGGKG